MNITVPIRLIAGSLCFLYLVLPIVFVPSIRGVLSLAPVATSDYLIGGLYSLATFVVILLSPRNFVIRADKLRINESLARIVAWSAIIASTFFFANALSSLDTLIYFDKVAAHSAYEELNIEYGLRLKYNVLLCIFLLSSIRARMKIVGVLFFLVPVLFEVVFSKHNYATHLLTYLFILAWNLRISRKGVLVGFALAVVVLLGLRFTFYSDFQNDGMQSLAAMIGEFTISWQSIPSAMTYSGSTFTGPAQWYSDLISSASGLEIGLAGNPVAEAIFYCGDWAGVVLIAGALGFVGVVNESRRSSAGSVAMLVTVYYLRDCFRTGWSLGFSVYLKSIVVFAVVILIVNGFQWLSGRLRGLSSRKVTTV